MQKVTVNPVHAGKRFPGKQIRVIQREYMILRPEPGIVFHEKGGKSFYYGFPVIQTAVILKIHDQLFIQFFGLSGLFQHIEISFFVRLPCMNSLFRRQDPVRIL